MKNLVFVIFFFVSLGLFSDGTNWISYDGWVTGPGANENNKYTYLLPFTYFPNDADGICMPVYIDEHPLLYETDMGWPVPNANETELKYLFFGDTLFFMRDEHHCVMSKITVESDDDDDNDDDDSDDNDRDFSLNFYIDEDVFDLYLGTDNDDDTDSDINYEQCDSHEPAEIERKYDFSAQIGNNLNLICINYCLTNSFGSNPDECSDWCSDFYTLFTINSSNYNECFSFCKSLRDNSVVFSYMNFDLDNKEDRCRNFCKFDMVDTYASLGYFAFNEKCTPEANNDLLANYNKGTSNIFLAATLDLPSSSNEYRYNINFQDTEETGYNSAQLYETTSDDPRKAKSVWMNNYERGLKGKVGIYTSGYFYACPGSPGNSGESCPQNSKKLFVPYNVTNWDILDEGTICKNANFNTNNMENEFKHLRESMGVGIYDFGNECRIRFSEGSDDLFPSCPPTVRSDGTECSRNESYPNKYILWPLLSKMSNVTVIHGLDRDILSPDDGREYIYFMGIGETEVDTNSIDCNTTTLLNYLQTQKIYIARVLAYESEIKCPASYEYFSGITNGISRWSKNMEDAEPLYGFSPLYRMTAESIVKHRDLYWMTARLNQTFFKGAVVLASPDALHWQKVDTILFQNPNSILADYAFFWLPPKLIESGDNTMPFLYSIWKNHQDPISGQYTLSGFLDPDLAPQFTRYNLKMGKYKFMMEGNETRAFLVDNVDYGSMLRNTIPINVVGHFINIPIFTFNDGAIPLSFNTFQNLDNLDNTGWSNNKISEEKTKLKNRYVIIEYCHCRDQSEENCKKFGTGNCQPYKDFIQTGETGNDVGNWKIIDIVNDEFFRQHVRKQECPEKQDGDPDYMCNIPFEHGENLPKGHKNTPVWDWRNQIAIDYPEENEDAANVILRFSHWYELPFVWDNYSSINKQLLENSQLVPFDCTIPGLTGQIKETCEDPSSWRTSKMIYLRYKAPKIDPIRLEYLYPYPAMISDFGKPGDPAPWVWDMLVADHFSREFFKVSSFEFGASVNQNLTSGAAATAVIKNGQMQIYAWGGTPYTAPRSVPSETLLYIGTYNPETEVVTFEQTQLVEREGNNSPEFTAGASMVYDDKNDKIYLIGALDKNGTTRIYSLEDDNMRSGLKTWRSVATIDLGRYFRLVKKSEHEYFAFGGETGTNTFTRKAYLLDLNNMASPQALQDIPTSGLANSFAAYSEMDQKLYVFGGLDENGASDRFLSYDIKTNTWSSINVAEGPGAGYGGVILVDYITETMSLGGGVFVNNEDRNFKWIFDPKTMTWSKELKSGSYCLKEADSAIQGGMETSGECVPFTHPFYNSFSAGTTVYSVAGKGNRLYAGTNDSIKIYDISDSNSPVLVSSFSTNNARVNDLEIEGDVLFAATSKGLYKLDTSDPDELEQILFVSTGSTSQNEIELYDGKVYAGDDDGIKIRDKETLSVLLSANSGQVYDFAIENGEIAMFRSSFLNSGIQFRNAETLVETAYDYTSCNNVEVENFNGELYLACDNYNYSFEANNGYIYFTQLSGDKRDLRENYTYNGYTYTPDGNYIRLSTNEDIPAICGNSIVEGDEVCDGTPIDCTELDENYVSGIAACNSTCDGYILDNCTAGNGGDGW